MEVGSNIESSTGPKFTGASPQILYGLANGPYKMAEFMSSSPTRGLIGIPCNLPPGHPTKFIAAEFSRP